MNRFRNLSRRYLSFFSCAVAFTFLLPILAPAQKISRYTCSSGKPKAGVVQLSASSLFTTDADGFDLHTAPSSFSNGSCASDKPFFFSASGPDGNYRVTLVLGGDAPATMTVRAESRRLLLMNQPIPASGSHTETFIVNVRTSTIHSESTTAEQVKLKPREIGALDWDNKLTLEFNGDHPSVRSITIEPVSKVPTIYLAGDSTVVDQDKEPWAAWGQMLPLFFSPAISIANHAESGETIRSFVGERRLAKIMSTIQPGDYLFVQFAHNDQKPGKGYVPAATEYKDLLKSYITQARAHGATPILVTSMNRRTFDAAGHITQTLGDYPATAREVAAEEHAALVDLNAMSKTLYEALGDAGTLHAFVHYPANTFPGQTEELKDDTHFNSYGAYELARCIVQSLRDQKNPLAAYLRKGMENFTPTHPDSLSAFSLPQSPLVSTETPYGR
ncbi:rhamnogalacturonan acetylesterase [Terriglobus saanensis]|uniref:Lipolytic protein G-D-S-L family n=1 Tax=Terriglobus saanensis (strain ATCC BAA-1853 / DSM 23119 / SP1PR4) TaxID=401053 RepID=E8V434_TERSS|nr:rhamnogalacturonan acetylesterase [Terriglobus saanensis]ADV82525.1 lipolytic protein G-D-S-L family [Terriglobus saanensis SP1PR4]